MDSSNVDSVFGAGKAIKRHGSRRGVDIDRLLATAEEARDAVMARGGA
jgi:hypothetical protein